jgi:hypothetical protein
VFSTSHCHKGRIETQSMQTSEVAACGDRRTIACSGALVGLLRSGPRARTGHAKCSHRRDTSGIPPNHDICVHTHCDCAGDLLLIVRSLTTGSSPVDICIPSACYRRLSVTRSWCISLGPWSSRGSALRYRFPNNRLSMSFVKSAGSSWPPYFP